MADFTQNVLQNVGALQGLAANKQAMDQQAMMMKQEQQADELLMQFQQGGGQDFGLVQKAVLLSPTKAQNVLATIGIADDIQKKQAASDIVSLRSALTDPATFRTAVAKRVQAIKDRGGDPTDTIGLVSLYEQGGPQAVEQELGFVGAALANEGYIKPELFGLAGSTEQPTSQREFEYYQRLQRENPEAAEKFARARGYIETGREENRTEAQRNLSEYNRLVKENPELAKQFGQSVGLVSKEGRELSAQSQKRLSEFTDAAVENQRLEQKYLTLADDFQKSGMSGGLQTTWTEAAKELSGNQDEISALRREFLKVRGSEVVNNLPPGAASDADIAMALSGFPSDKASAEQVSGFLRGLAKLKGFNAKFNEFKANYISDNGSERGMLAAWKEQSAQSSAPSKLSKDQFTGQQKAPAAQPKVIGRFQIEVVE